MLHRHHRRTPKRVQVVIHFLLLLTWAGSALASQDSAENQPEVTINIGVSTAKPGEQIQIPLTLSGPTQTPVGSIVEEIAFSKDALEFTGTETGLAAELSDAEVKVSSKNDGDMTVLEVTISGKEALRAGILAYMNMNVPADAKKGSIIITARSSKAATVAGEPVPLRKGEDGEITVFGADETIPILGCFFFTH